MVAHDMFADHGRVGAVTRRSPSYGDCVHVAGRASHLERLLGIQSIARHPLLALAASVLFFFTRTTPMDQEHALHLYAMDAVTYRL